MDSENQRYQVILPEASHTIDSVQVAPTLRNAPEIAPEAGQVPKAGQVSRAGQVSKTGQVEQSAPRIEPLHSTASPTVSAADPLPAIIEGVSTEELLDYIRSGQVWMVNSRQRNGVILCKPFHTEFAGPGAAVGGYLDLDCQQVIPMGKLSLVQPASNQERQNAYLIRRQWIKLTQQVTDKSLPAQRAQLILNQFETYFDQEAIARIPDEAFALMVGVLPYTIRMARRPPGKLTVRVRG